MMNHFIGAVLFTLEDTIINTQLGCLTKVFLMQTPHPDLSAENTSADINLYRDLLLQDHGYCNPQKGEDAV